MKRIALSISTVFFALILCAQSNIESPKVRTSVYHATSKPLREMKVIVPGAVDQRTTSKTIDNPSLEKEDWLTELSERMPADQPLSNVQSRQGNRSLGAPFVNVEGVDNLQSVAPADPNGDVGLNYYVQTVNASFAVFDKSGNLVYGPIHNTSLWESLPGPWEGTFSFGTDPVFKYDHLANRWVMTAFSINSEDDLYFELVAVSTSSDPLGSYNLYAFQFDDFNDYPKLAIWHDAYYITYNMFRDGNRIEPRITALDKDAMIAGEPEARMIEFVYDEGLRHNIPYCTDIEGFQISPDIPNYILSPVANPMSDPPFAALHLYEFSVDWEHPDSSTLEFVQAFPQQGGMEGFDKNAVQPGGSPPIDALEFRLMYPVSYRDFGTHESIVACRTLRFPGEHFHKRWYELRRDTGDWYIHQSGSYLRDGIERWMGSINMNGKGDIALGYTASSNDLYPSVRYTGRLRGDSLNKMTIREINAFGSDVPVDNQPGTSGRNRWGDYSSMSIDPVGDTTFWYTSMYPISPVTFGNWTTRIIAFNLREDALNIRAEAGLDRLICDTDRITTNAFASNYSKIFWTSSGDGIFGDEEAINTTYILGSEDKNQGEVVLTLHAVGYAPGEEVTDSLTVYWRNNPIADAGMDTTICNDQSYMLEGEVMFVDSFRWETVRANSGTFSDPRDLNAIFTPSNLDIFRGFADLELLVYNSRACDPLAEDEVRINLEACTDIEDPVGNRWMVDLQPNPFEQEFTVTISGPGSDTFTLEIYNQNGRKLFNGTYRPGSGGYSHTYDLRKQPAGTYYLRLYNETTAVTRQIIKR